VRSRLGINPIAVVPVELFNGVCEKFKLMRLENMDSEGRTHFDSVHLENHSMLLAGTLLAFLVHLIVQLSTHASIAGILASAAFIWSTYIWLHAISGDDFNARPLFYLLAIPLGGLAYGMNPLSLDTLICVGWGVSGVLLWFISFFVFVCLEWAWRRLAQRRLLPSRYVSSVLWPNGCDESRGDQVTIRFRLAPPAKFAMLLKKMHETSMITPSVATVPEALTIRPANLGFRENRRFGRLDPILYHRHQGTVAILDQFGSFPNEQAVLKWARTEGIRLIAN
jgi:hypothetical protein